MANNERNTGFINEKDLTFKNLFIRYIKDQELISIFHLTVSLAISLILLYLVSRYNLEEFKKTVCSIFISASTDIFGVLLAAFGLYAVITDIAFSKKILKLGQLRNLLFPFWLCSTMWAINLLSCIIVNGIFMIKDISQSLTSNILFIIILFFIITLGYTLALIGDILKLTIFRVQLEVQEEQGEVNLDIEDIETINKDYQRAMKIYYLISLFSVSYFLVWYYGMRNILLATITLGAILLATVFAFYKFYTKLAHNNQINLQRRLKLIIKVILIISGLWIKFNLL